MYLLEITQCTWAIYLHSLHRIIQIWRSNSAYKHQYNIHLNHLWLVVNKSLWIKGELMWTNNYTSLSLMFIFKNCCFNVHLFYGRCYALLKQEFHVDSVIIEDPSGEYYCNIRERPKEIYALVFIIVNSGIYCSCTLGCFRGALIYYVSFLIVDHALSSSDWMWSD